jgi:phosphatidylserine/phosphatidylglycerophosphate/cardiolipin synthase-like enzyme
MMLFQKKDSNYYGSASHKYVDRLLREGSEILIVSPYIDGYYARMIKKSGRRFYIISSSPTDEAERILSGGRSLMFSFSVSLAVVAADYLASILHLLSTALLIVSVLLILVSALYYIRGSPKVVWLRKPRRFTHAKMYVSDKTAIEGSANLTYKGMHENVEHIGVSYDEARISELRKQFWKMWNSL